jgi:hypothetical protein
MGDGWCAIVNTAGRALEDFYQRNPGVADCASSQLDYAGCVGFNRPDHLPLTSFTPLMVSSQAQSVRTFELSQF